MRPVLLDADVMAAQLREGEQALRRRAEQRGQPPRTGDHDRADLIGACAAVIEQAAAEQRRALAASAPTPEAAA